MWKERSSVECARAHVDSIKMEENHIRKWVCVNSPVTPVARQETAVVKVVGVAEQQSQSISASKYRDAILKSASRINDLRMHQPKKRKNVPCEQATPKSKKRNTTTQAKPKARKSAQTEGTKKESQHQRLPLGGKDPNIKSFLAATKQHTPGQHDASCIPPRKNAAIQDRPKTNPACVSKLEIETAFTAQSHDEKSKATLASTDQDKSYDGLHSDTQAAWQDMQDQSLEGATTKRSKVATKAQKTFSLPEYDGHNAQNLKSAAINQASLDNTMILSPPDLGTKCSQEALAEVGDIDVDTANVMTNLSTSQSSSLASRASIRPFLRKAQHNRIDLNEDCPIPRMLPAFRIPTCFRIAEVSRHLKDSIFMIELYAIATQLDILPSDGSQIYRLADLFFPDRPPYLTGTYTPPAAKTIVEPSSSGTITKSSEVNHEQNSPSNLNQNPPPSSPSADKMLVRVMILSLPVKSGTPSLNKNSISTVLSSLSHRPGVIAHVHIEAIWESDWDEVEYVRGIVDPDGAEVDRKSRVSD